MPAWIRKMFGLKPKLKVNIPKFKTADEYSLWRNKTYGEPLPQKMLNAQEAAKKRMEAQEAQRQVVMDGLRTRQEQKEELKRQQANPTKK